MSQYPPPGQYPPGQYPPPPPGQYPPPGGGQYWQESPKGKGMAITALVLGILAILGLLVVFGGFVFGLFAVIFGIIALVKSRRGTGAGAGMAVAGLILGIIGIVAASVIAVLGFRFFEEIGGTDYVDCLSNAGGDQAKIEQCERDFQQNIEDKYSITLTPRPTP
ncbi:DUF4190 domain-containing protein [Nocardia bovistercoris]|uniref:DUF4190 domain-containing protein n=1 Tax=Nocardia bovistercoris TaxID=2785916 RepID=A0A931IGD0_9NOCA|nr:DUF4190 domain-containing protein [Nocardia bovistercoris]MBH0781227.1 DUF4190 domain-containing protein [Nocardia bovistercoris]